MALPSASPASTSEGSADTIAFTRSSSPALMASKNAAAGDASGMRRFYPFLASGAVVLSTLACAAAAAAQTPPPRERPALGSTITVAPLADLPANENALSLLDGAQADLI